MTRILVTGATGCIGHQACRLLADSGWEVHAVSRTPDPSDRAVRPHQVDLFDGAAVRRVMDTVRPSHLLHLAWSIPPGRWAADPGNVRWVTASLDLVEAFAAAGGQRLVTAGSCLEYDWRYGYCAEGLTPTTPHTLYGACKHSLRLLSSGLAEARGMTSAWARIFFLYGPNEHPDRLIPSVIQSLLADRPARCSHGRQVRDYLYVRDVADALVRLVDSDVTGPINVGSGQPISLRTLVGRVGELLDRTDLIQFGAKPAAETDAPLVVADTGQLRSVLGWEPRYDLDRGLGETIEWWRHAPATMSEAPA